MKKFIAILLACVLSLCCVCAGAESAPTAAPTEAPTEASALPIVPAEGAEGWRLYNDMTIDQGLLETFLWNFSPDIQTMADRWKAGAIMDAAEPELIVMENGIQLAVDLKGENAVTIGGIRTEDGVAIASTLFPSYVITVSTERIQEIVSGITSALSFGEEAPEDAEAGDAEEAADEAAPEEAGEAAETAEAPQTAGAEEAEETAEAPETAEAEAAEEGETALDAPQDDSKPVTLLDRLMSLVVTDGPETGVFRADGVTYDVRQTYAVGRDNFQYAWNSTVDWIFNSKAMAPLMELAQNLGMKINLDEAKAMLPLEKVPRVSVAVYSHSLSDGFCFSTLVNGSGDTVYASGELTLAEKTLRGRVALPQLGVDGDFSVELLEDGLTGRARANLAGTVLYANLDLGPDASGQGVCFTASLFQESQSSPLFQEVFICEPADGLTLDFSDKGKIVIPITKLFSMEDGALPGLAMDIVFNGLSHMADVVDTALPELDLM